MTRIKEHMELLTSEMEGFQSEVNRLEAINESLKDLKVSIDLKELKAELEYHRSQLEKQRKHQDQFYTKMELLFKNAGTYDKWAILTLIVVILLSAASLLYVCQTKTVL